MVSDIQIAPLGSFLSEKPRNGLYKGKEFQSESGNRWIKMSELYSLSFLNNEETAERLQVNNSELERFSCVDGDLLFGRTSLTLEGVGDCLLVTNVSDRPVFESNLFRLRFDKNKASPLFFYYFFKSRSGRDIIQRIAKQTAATSITAADLIQENVPCLSLKHQVSIAEKLHSIDNKITLNRQINQTLEQMAQALFKSWFVDFDPVVDNALDGGFFEQDLAFPDELLLRAEARKAVCQSRNFKPLPEDIRQLFPAAFEESSEPSLGIGGWVPKGWGYKCFGELLSSTIGGDWGKDSQDEKHTTQSRIVRGTDIPDLINGQVSNAPLRWVEPKKLKSRKIEAGDIILEVSGGSPTQSTGRSIFMTQSMLDRLGGIVEPASFCRRFNPKSFGLGMLASLHLQAIYSDGKMWEYQNQSTGIANFQTTFFLEAERVLIPTDEVLEEFLHIVKPLIEKSQNNEQVALAKLRDTLLPKLISGELRLDEIEADIAEEGAA